MLVGALVAAGCVQSTAVICSDGTICAAGFVCDEAHGQCLLPDQLTSCTDKPAGDACPIPGQQGVCRDGLCLAVRCGDGIAEGSEQCDGGPPALSCFEVGYDAGFLGCLDNCAPDFAACRRVGWRDVESPGSGSVTAIASAGGIGLAGRGTLVLRYQGSTWEPMVLPQSSGFVLAVFATAADRGFAATEDGLYRLDGDTWQRDPQSYSDAARARLTGTGPTDVFLFVDDQALHHDGQTWSALPPLSSRGADASTETPGQVWVADANGNLQHYANDAWTTIATPLMRVDAVRERGGTVAIAGWTAAGAAVVARRTGTTWSTVDISTELGTLPVMQRAGLRLGAGTASELIVFAPGYPQVLEQQGAGWQRTATLPNPPSVIEAVGDEVFGGVSNGLVRRAANTFAELGDQVSAVGPTTGGRAVTGTRCDDIYVASSTYSTQDDATLFRFDGDSWRLEHTAGGRTINSVFATGAGDVYATTSSAGGGVVLRRSGDGTWSVMQTFPTNAYAVWATDDGVVVVVGGGGWLHRYDGTWTSVRHGGADIASVWGTSANDVYAVPFGSDAILHFDGTQWTDEPLPALTGRLRAVWGNDETIIVVGSLGEALHRSDGVWRREQLPFDDYVAVHGTSAGDVFAVGNQGTLAHFDGTHWAPVHSPIQNPSSVWTGGGCTYVAADYQAIELHRLTRREPW